MRKAVAMALVVSLIASSVVSAQRERRPPQNLDSGGQIATDSSTLPTGTIIIVKLDTRLDSATSRTSDRFRARVFRAVTDARGRELIPQSAWVEGYISGVTPAQRKRRSGLISVTFDTLRLPDGRALPIAANLTAADPDDRKRIDEEGNIKPTGSTTWQSIVFVGGGTSAGAAIGLITGGLLLGTGIGAAVGVAAAWLAKGKDAVVEPGTLIGVELVRPLDVALGSTGIVRLDPRPHEQEPQVAPGDAQQPTPNQTSSKSRNKTQTPAQTQTQAQASAPVPPQTSPSTQAKAQAPGASQPNTEIVSQPSTQPVAEPTVPPVSPPVAAPKADASLAEVGARVADKASVLSADYAASIGAKRRDDGGYDFPTHRILKVDETELLFTLSSLKTSTETFRGVLGAEATMDSRRRGADRLTKLTDETRRLWAAVKPKAELDRKWVALDREIQLLVDMAKAGS